MMSNEQNPLIKLYGLDALDLASDEIKELNKNSNIPFDKELLQLGTSFILLKATEIIEGKKSNTSLKLLVSESFGEASIYRYNVIDRN
jgi:hypothetical protein